MAGEKRQLLDIFSDIVRRTARSFTRFPLTFFYFALFLINLTVNTAFALFEFQIVESISITFLVGAVLNMALVALKERSRKIASIFSAVSFLGFFSPFLFFLTLYLFPLNVLWLFRGFAVGFILFLLFMIIPGYKRIIFEFDKMVIIVIKSGLAALLFSGFLYGGLYTLLYAVKSLYVTGLSSKPSLFALYFCILVFLIVFLGSLPSFSASEETEDYLRAVRYPVIAENLLSYVFIPVITAFTLMFVGYSLKILISGAWPSNQVVRFVFFYSALGFAAYIMTGHIKNLFCDFFRGYFPLALILFNSLAAFSLYQRIREFSLTYYRYFGIIAIVFFVTCGLIYLIRKRIYLIATVLMLCFAIASAALPMVNFYDVSCYSQMLRAQKILEENFMLESGILKPNAELTSYEMAELYSAVNYFTSRGKANYASWLPASFNISDFKKYFGFDEGGNNDIENFYYRTYTLEDTNYSITGYDTAINTVTEYLDNGVVDSADFQGKKGSYHYELVSDNASGSLTLTLKLNGNTIISNDFKDFTNYIKNELKNELDTSQGVENNGLESYLPFDKMSAVMKGGGSKLLIVFHTVVDNRSAGANSSVINSLNVTASVYFDEYN